MSGDSGSYVESREHRQQRSGVPEWSTAVSRSARRSPDTARYSGSFYQSKQHRVASHHYPLSNSSTAASSPVAVVVPHTSPLLVKSTQHNSSLLPSPVGVFRDDSPPSPSLTRSLLALAQQRKKGGQHSLGSDKVLHLSPNVSTPDRTGIPDEVYKSLLSAASFVKKNGRHTLQRRRSGGMSGEEVRTVLVSTDAARPVLRRQPTYPFDQMPVLSPSMF